MHVQDNEAWGKFYGCKKQERETNQKMPEKGQIQQWQRQKTNWEMAIYIRVESSETTKVEISA